VKTKFQTVDEIKKSLELSVGVEGDKKNAERKNEHNDDDKKEEVKNAL
jgi:hypothetical protein